MKITYKEYHAVASWRWNVDPNHTEPPTRPPPNNSADSTSDDVNGLVGDSDVDQSGGSDEEDDESEEEDEMCGVCQQEFESACPACKVPGDDCPLIWGACKHVFHMHCLLQWLQTPSSKEQCPLDRRPWVPAGS
ncbi:hypothetical protein NliqN6_4638 [Naganishia liquefaciens]|uniref:Anaphase-promoting complex subunit 11 n=1 Tax=Naganishia liquefaciens TaxID=104408 RepID=A0A8H3TWL3_9TREE|nr:hypothetical protein NliqN6_4638 [Naganishia liquefaciens]